MLGNKKENINISLEVFKEHFKNLLVEGNPNTNELNVPIENLNLFDTSKLNRYFTETEIRNFVNKLKNNKAVGIDRILNEFIKCSIELMIPLYVKLFNKILHS